MWCSGNQCQLCANSFAKDVVDKREVLEIVARKASAKLNRQVRAIAVDKTAAKVRNEQMEQLLQFGKAHSDVVKIKKD